VNTIRTIRVLLVDDQSSVRLGLTMRLQLESDIVVVGAVEDGESALRDVESLDPDVIVMDYEMPGMNGVETAKAVHAAGHPCPVVMLSLHDNADLRRSAEEAGVVDFVAKHRKDEVLLEAIRHAASLACQGSDR
jgi:DNA-binding NarL/FixJ family response regulator